MTASPDSPASSPEPPVEPSAEVDARGMACPLPVIELAKAVKVAEVGDVIRLFATDEAAHVDVPVWCRMQRQKLRSRTTDDDGALVFDVEVTRAI